MKFYVDTSVWGGIGDKEFAEWTLPFFEQARKGLFTLVISDVTLQQFGIVPLVVQELIASIPSAFLDIVNVTEEQVVLSQRYIFEGAISETHHIAAKHIAIATVLKVDSLVSWNFNHIVNFFRIKQYNSINLKYGYTAIEARTPQELVYVEPTKKEDGSFHAVEFMRKARLEMSELYHSDKQEYLRQLDESMTKFENEREELRKSGKLPLPLPQLP